MSGFLSNDTIGYSVLKLYIHSPSIFSEAGENHEITAGMVYITVSIRFMVKCDKIFLRPEH